ncbi:MAG: DNA starvation/stationary phase protection protein [Gammaproteobacteria bacterium]|jgi:starvation-inducible DNA-binding protein|nr:DNA starvation/stationary phase protection protein [Gammaproteobacteria bacterium]
MQIEIGLSDKQREHIADGLAHLLADSYTLYIKTHNYHWNVTGPQFKSLHELFEEHYLELATAVDEIAERIRALGHFAPGSYKEFSKLTVIEEEAGHPAADLMVRTLVTSHERVAKTARQAFKYADEAGDEPTCDLLTVRMQFHEKTAWMLRSMLES